MKLLPHLPHLTILLVAYMVREYKIEKGNFVIWDEAHFGKFSQSYLNRTFYFDVHPPYGKMLTALSGYVFGQSDAFKFTSRDNFPESFDYVGMRRVHALISSLVPLFAYLILRKFKLSVRRSMLCSLIFIFDNGMTSIGRLILLDSHLLAFTAATAYILTCFVVNRQMALCRTHLQNLKEAGTREYNAEGNVPPGIGRMLPEGQRIPNKTGAGGYASQDGAMPDAAGKRSATAGLDKGTSCNCKDKNMVRYKRNVAGACTNMTGRKERRTGASPIQENRSRFSMLKSSREACTCPSVNRLNVAALGIVLGCVISIKWIGCLVMLLVGLYIIYDLYMKLLCCKVTRLLYDFAWYALLLIVVPSAIYVAFFYAHFKIVDRSGEDDGFMSTGFQLSLKGSSFGRTRKYISFGKQITIKCARGYLHSHMHVYPEQGASDQMAGEEEALRQVTIYSAKDSNNNFYFQSVTDDKSVAFLKNLDNVVIFHADTKGYLEPDQTEAYFSEGRRMVNRKGAPMRSSVWIVESNKDSVQLEDKVRAISTEFCLKSLEHSCYLSASDKNYPGWGYNQGELFCAKEKKDATAWQVEENFWAETEDNPLYTNLRKSFVSRLFEHNALMYKTNKGFRQSDDLEPEKIVSSPGEWPILRRGLRMSQWGEKHKFYMFMNPLLLYVSTLAVIVAPLVYLCRVIRYKRQAGIMSGRQSVEGALEIVEGNRPVGLVEGESMYKSSRLVAGERADLHQGWLSRDKKDSSFGDSPHSQCGRCANKDRSLAGTSSIVGRKLRKQQRVMDLEGFFIFLSFAGWAVHYLAFFCVGRVLYLHHYFPAYFFALLCLCYLLRFAPVHYLSAFVACSMLVYFCYSPLTYGFIADDEVKHLKLQPGWDFIE